MTVNDSIKQKMSELYDETQEVHQRLNEAEEKMEMVTLLRERHTGEPVPITEQIRCDLSYLQETLHNSSELKKKVEKLFNEYTVRVQKHIMMQRVENEMCYVCCIIMLICASVSS